MTCKCGSTRLMSVSGKCNDTTGVQVGHLGIEYCDYVPSHIGLGGGDYIRFKVCLDCGQLQNWNPVSDDDLKAALGIEEDE